MDQLAAVQSGLVLRSRGAPPDIQARLQAMARRLGTAIAAGRARPGDDAALAWERLNSAFIAAREELSRWLGAALAPGPPSAEDLPPALRDQWVGRDGSWLLMVFPAHDAAGRSVLDPERLESFITAVRAVAGEATLGPPVQIHESSRVIVRAYTLAACYALGVILILLLLDFRSLADAVSCVAPVTLGFIGAFGVMGLAGLSLNFANLIVMPLIFGIGVDASVNIVHRWRQEPYGRPAGLSGGTGRGITLALLTTMIGFGCLIISDHRGIRSLGIVMLVGLAVTLLSCYTVLPALLRLRTAPQETPQAPSETDVEVIDTGMDPAGTTSS
jgi:hypothetical protein